MIISFIFLVMIIGLILFLASKANPDVKEVGRIMFFCGLFAICIRYDEVFKVLGVGR